MNYTALSLLHIIVRSTEVRAIVNIRVRASWSLTWKSLSIRYLKFKDLHFNLCFKNGTLS